MKNAKEKRAEKARELKNETFKTIPGFGRYQASNLGRVRSLNNDGTPKQILQPTQIQNKYHQVTLRMQNKSFRVYVHRLVLLTFKGACPIKF